MSIAPAPFDHLAGIGPATAAKLHHAGIVTWDRLAETASAFASIRGASPAVLREVSRRAAEAHRNDDRHNELADDTDGRRREAFALRLELDASGATARSGAVHVGSQRERQWAGWSSDEFARFVAEIVGGATAGHHPPVLQLVASDPSPADDHDARSRAKRDGGGDGDGDGDAAHRGDVAGLTPLAAGGSDAGPVVVPAGNVVGGSARTVHVAVPAALARPDSPCYRARLRARPIGHGDAAPAAVAELRGDWTPGTDLDLAFAAVELPAGVHHLDVSVELWAPSTDQAVSTIAARTSRYTPRV